jgi:hypothetical protein
MLRLPNVTLCAFGSTNIEGMEKALEESSRKIKFGEVKLINHPCNGIDEWNRNIVYELGSYINTDFAILIHPDGYIVNPDCWTNDFLKYDYIGSPWPLPSPTDHVSYRGFRDGKIKRVGNSVSLRSKKLMDLPKKINMEWKAYHGFTNEDGYICVNKHHVFEDNDCYFAPVELAAHWGREHDVEENKEIEKTFTFHQHFSPRNLKYKIFE